MRSWDLPLGADPGQWTTHFERVADPDPLVRAAVAGDAGAARAALRAPRMDPTGALACALAGEAAAERGAAEVLTVILRDAPPAPSIAAGWLHRAAGQGKAETVEALVQAGVPADTRDAVGQTPLIHAAAGDEATVRVLLSHGADPAVVTPGGVSARKLAAAHRHEAIVALLAPPGD